MTRLTSIEAYYKMIPVVSERRKELLDVLLDRSNHEIGMTAEEVFAVLKTKEWPKIRYGFERTRFTELRKMNLVYEVCERKCSIMKGNVIAWHPTWSVNITRLKREDTQAETIKMLGGLVGKYQGLLNKAILEIRRLKNGASKDRE